MNFTRNTKKIFSVILNFLGNEMKIDCLDEKFNAAIKNLVEIHNDMGPEGRRCKHCKFFFRNEMAKTYFKCEKVRKYWTGGSKTDIKANAKSCRLFKEKQE